MNTTTTQTPPAFIGYWRPHKGVVWSKLAEGPDYDTTWGLLLDALTSTRGGDSLVIKAGVDPNRPAPKYRAGGRRML